MSVKKILIIDDEEDFCRALKKSLEMKSSFQVLTATRGKEGMRLAKTQQPDLILLDIMMPDMAGTEVAEKLSDDPATASIPIIFVTAIIQQNELKNSDGVAGGQTIIAKPVILDTLIKIINTI